MQSLVKHQSVFSQEFIALGIQINVPNLVQIYSPAVLIEIEDCAVLRFKTKLGKLILWNEMM
jgi:hypothetical protein